jgi:predicted transcriptional regulator
MKMLKTVSCFEFLPLSGKVVVLDSTLSVPNAVGALLQNGIHSAPLYNADSHNFDGMFTVTDLIRLILYLDKTCGCYDEALSLVSTMTLKNLNQLQFKNFSPESFVMLNPDATLLDAAKLLLKSKIHRLPIVSDDHLILSVLSQSKIVRFIALNVICWTYDSVRTDLIGI